MTVPADVGLEGAHDEDHLAHTRQHGLVLVTKNPGDFRRLHDRFQAHPGVLVVYQDNDPTRDMTDAEVVQAITNLLAAGVAIANALHALNYWRY